MPRYKIEIVIDSALGDDAFDEFVNELREEIERHLITEDEPHERILVLSHQQLDKLKPADRERLQALFNSSVTDVVDGDAEESTEESSQS